jgi:hypothetical protein
MEGRGETRLPRNLFTNEEGREFSFFKNKEKNSNSLPSLPSLACMVSSLITIARRDVPQWPSMTSKVSFPTC